MNACASSYSSYSSSSSSSSSSSGGGVARGPAAPEPKTTGGERLPGADPPPPGADPPPPGAPIAAAARSFREYRALAEAEQRDADAATLATIRHCVLNLGRIPEGLVPGGQRPFPNTTELQVAAQKGNLPLMETLVALGDPIDAPTADPPPEGDEVPFPPGVSALVMACAMLAGSASADHEDQLPSRGLDWVAECAMQLVRLGADPTMKLPDGVVHAPFDGKSAFQLAAMTQRRPLVALMWEHMQMSQEERAEVVHCRCGSRLLWKRCHSTGVGQPSHYALDATTRKPIYRVSPHARCPCHGTNKTYYKCCWKDNRIPVYLNDTSGAILSRNVDALSLPSLGQCLNVLAAQEPGAALILRGEEKGDGSWFRSCANLFRDHPPLFAALCDDVGPKSRMTAWDPLVYAECVERLEFPFLWRDVHWDLDHSVLIRRSEEWNDALHEYCDDVGLDGAERERVVSLHGANPCGPCGYGGCPAFEDEVREFRRCSGCKAISYCSRNCQKKDWAEHKKVCQACKVAPQDLALREGHELVNIGHPF